MKNGTWTLADAKSAAARIQASRGESPAKQREPLAFLAVTLPRLLPGLNGSDGLIRQHYRKAAAEKDKLLAWAKSQRFGTFGDARVSVVCTRHYCGNPMDFDNAAASFKHLMDVIVRAGVIQDDGPKTIEAMTFRQVRCKSKKEQKMTVEISIFSA